MCAMAVIGMQADTLSVTCERSVRCLIINCILSITIIAHLFYYYYMI